VQTKVIPSKLDEAIRWIEEIVSQVERLGYGKEDIFSIRLCLEEALTNAIMHGNKENPQKSVVIEYELTPEQVKVCVEDEGEGFDPNELPDPTSNNHLLSLYGRGVFLMQQFMDNVSYNPKGNCITLIKRNQLAEQSGK